MESNDFLWAMHEHLMRRDPSIENVTIVFDGRGRGTPIVVPGHLIVGHSVAPYMLFDTELWQPKPGVETHFSGVQGVMTVIADRFYGNQWEAYPFLRTLLEPIGDGEIGWPAHQWPDDPRFKNDVWIYAPD